VHLSGFHPLTANTLNGSIGVDLFFIISGFIISASVENLPAERPIHSFFVNRFSRVAPYYYLLTIVYALGAYISWGNVPTFDGIVTSALFVSQGQDPIHPVGWTLNHEIFFYVFVGLGLFITRDMKRIALLFLLVFVGLQFISSSSPFLKELRASINLEFLFGMLIYQFRDQLSAYFRNGLWPVAALILLLVVISVAVESPTTDQMKALTSASAYYRDTTYLRQFPITLPRGLLYGIPSAFVFITVFAQEPRLAHFNSNNLMLKIGNASFTLYLIQHLFIIIIIRFVVYRPVTLLVFVAVMIATSLKLYKLENYVARHVKRLLLRVS
jgi:peptidoglycan/LPS O-acetylase OafA/YrhL